jgi:hypothetical protein
MEDVVADPGGDEIRLARRHEREPDGAIDELVLDFRPEAVSGPRLGGLPPAEALDQMPETGAFALVGSTDR